MQQALPYREWRPSTGGSGSAADPAPGSTSSVGGDQIVNDSKNVKKLVAENAVVVFARRGCCMCHVVRLLLHGHGVNPSIFDVDEQNEASVKDELSKIVGVDASAAPQFPAVFVGGNLFGGLEEVMGAHISGDLVPRLREARALWL